MYIGGYGEVYKGIWRGSEVAVKRLFAIAKFGESPFYCSEDCSLLMPCHADDDKDKAKEAAIAFVREIKLLSRLSHPNIVLFMGACIHPDAQYIVTEFVARGSLYDIIHSKSQRNPQNRQSLTRSLTISQENC